MQNKITNKLKTINPWHFLWIAVVLSEIFTVIINIINSLLWWGEISIDLLLIGAIDALIVSIIIAFIIVYFLKHTIRIEKLNETLQKDMVVRKEVERELIHEKNKFQYIIDYVECGITIRDLDYNLTYHNHVVTNIFGNSIGKKCYRLFEGRDAICEECPVEKAFKDGKSHSLIKETILPSGETNTWLNVANPITDSKGKIISCIEINTNITERKNIEKKLKESEQKYVNLLESLKRKD